MTIFALGLVILGSIFHLMWNILTKQAHDKLAFLWLAIMPPGLIMLVFSGFRYEYNAEATSYVVATILIHAFYFWALTNAYKFADLSLVYPYGRGIGAIVATMTGIFLLSERPSFYGVIGIALTLLGTFIEPLLNSRKKLDDWRGVAFTGLSGLTIASYLTVDKLGIKKLDPVYYLALMLLGAGIVLAPLMLRQARAWKELKRNPRGPVLGGFFLFTAYGLILFAMERAPLSYVVAARTSGIVLSGLAGIVFFKEELNKSRWIAILLICFGVFFTGLA